MPHFYTFPGEVKQGNLVLDNRSRFQNFVKGFEGKKVEIILRKRKKQRSDQQNRYYFGVCVKILADHFGYTVEEMHEALKWKFLKVQSDPDHPIETVKSTASLSTVEFMELIAQIQIWAATEFSIVIPDPREIDYAEYDRVYEISC